VEYAGMPVTMLCHIDPSEHRGQHQFGDIDSDTSEQWWYLKLSVKEGCVPATKKTGLVFPR